MPTPYPVDSLGPVSWIQSIFILQIPLFLLLPALHQPVRLRLGQKIRYLQLQSPDGRTSPRVLQIRRANQIVPKGFRSSALSDVLLSRLTDQALVL